MSTDLPEGTLTILFTDVESSTELTTTRGEEAARAALRAHEELVRQHVHEHGGHEVKAMGDGFMVAFASARRAVSCAVAIQRALEEQNRQHPQQRLAVRMGLNTGEALHEKGDLFGEAVNATARISAKARGGQILVSEAVKAVLGRAPDLNLVDRGRFRLKGFPERWRLFEVVWQEDRAAVSPALLERTPFVGHEAERAELRRLLERARAGRGALIMIGGEPGVGKTRLCEETMAEARERGMTALIGRCYEMEGALPYIAFVEMAEGAARLFPADALRTVLGDSAPEVARLIPELRRMFPDIPQPPAMPPEQERRYLFNGMREFIARSGRAQPLLLVLDDLHWADDATLLLLQHVAQELHDMSVLLLGTYRDVELDVARPLANTLEQMVRQRLALRISLKRLPEEGVAAMLQALSGREPPAALVQALFSETEGNPFFVEEVFRHLAEEGKLFDTTGRWRPDLRVSELDVPEGVRLVIGRRLERVSEECRRVLTAAAVMGRAFTFELLETLGDPSAGSGQGVEADALLDAIDEAERAHLIAAAADGPEARFSFAHELIRQTLASGLSLPRRQRLHLRIAEAMERVYADSLEERAADLAHHLYQAGTSADAAKTVRYLTSAGDRAYGAAAFEEALRHYENGLSLAPAEDRRARADLHYKRGLALRSVGRWEEALADWRAALDVYEALGESETVGRLCREIAEQLNWGARFLEGLEISRRGLIALGDQKSADRCRLLAMVGMMLGGAGQYSAASGMIGEAITMAEALGDPALLGHVLVSKCWLHGFYPDMAKQRECGTRAVALLREAGDLWNLVDALWMAGSLYTGRFAEVLKTLDELETVANRAGHVGGQAVHLWGLATVKMGLEGDLQAMEQLSQQSLKLTERSAHPLEAIARQWLAVARYLRGNWQVAEEDFEESLRLLPPGRGVWMGLGPLFVLKAYTGQREAALAMLAEARELLPRPGQPIAVGALNTLLFAVEGLGVLGEREEAAKLYPLVVEAIARTGLAAHGQGEMLLECYAGIAAACGRQWEKAEEHYQTALRQAHDMPHRIAQGDVRRWYARMLIDRDGLGDRDKAFRLLTEAIAMYKQIGMPKHVEMAEAMLRECH